MVYAADSWEHLLTMSRCRFSREVSHDMEEIGRSIAEDNFEAAIAYVGLIRPRRRLLTSQPLMGRPRDELFPSLRSFPVGQHVIFYRPVKNDIQIIRVLHGARDIEALFE